mgnify:CR=1 FL=1
MCVCVCVCMCVQVCARIYDTLALVALYLFASISSSMPIFSSVSQRISLPYLNQRQKSYFTILLNKKRFCNRETLTALNNVMQQISFFSVESGELTTVLVKRGAHCFY